MRASRHDWWARVLDAVLELAVVAVIAAGAFALIRAMVQR